MVSIILINYFHKGALKECLASILADRFFDLEILIVNNSPQEDLKFLLKLDQRIKIIKAKKNLGYAAGCNLAAAKAKGEYLVFLNPDSEVNEYWLEEGLRPFKSQSVGAVMSKILDSKNKKVNSRGGEINYTGIAWAGGYGEEDKKETAPYEVGFASGASLFIKRDDFFSAGKHDPDFFMYFDDVDLSSRLRLLGKKIFCAPHSIIYHDYEFKKGDYKLYYMERNRLCFIFRNFSSKILFFSLPALILIEIAVSFYYLLILKLHLKIKADFNFLFNLRKLVSQRRIIQRTKTISDREYFSYFKPKIRSKAIDNSLLRLVLNPLLLAYYFLLKKII